MRPLLFDFDPSKQNPSSVTTLTCEVLLMLATSFMNSSRVDLARVEHHHCNLTAIWEAAFVHCAIAALAQLVSERFGHLFHL
uniref:Uncharacterized protein n=1 Tax=Arundo donax TaxID=35708 RepID=A0A0A9AQE9_ARUDO